MRKVIFLMLSAIAVGSMFVPLGPVGPQQANASFFVPEPSSVILLGLGLAGLARYLRKR